MHRQFSTAFPGIAMLQRGFWSRAGARRSPGRTLVQDLRNGQLDVCFINAPPVVNVQQRGAVWPGNAAILAASGAGGTPALPGDCLSRLALAQPLPQQSLSATCEARGRLRALQPRHMTRCGPKSHPVAEISLNGPRCVIIAAGPSRSFGPQGERLAEGSPLWATKYSRSAAATYRRPRHRRE
jgi:hypothetical protein